jgi:hypothetical protein
MGADLGPKHANQQIARADYLGIDGLLGPNARLRRGVGFPLDRQ